MYPWQHLLDNKGEYGISGFGVSVTTMEEVFIKVGEGSSELEDMVNEGKKQCKFEVAVIHNGNKIFCIKFTVSL